VFEPRRTSATPIASLAMLVTVLLALPFVVSEYLTFQLTLVMVSATALAGLHILTGRSGQISLGHGAFCAVGAYTTAILMNLFGMPYWLTVPVSGALGLGVGYLFGLPALRLEGPYLALATFALGVCTPQLLKTKYAEAWTGGVQGLHITIPSAPTVLALGQDAWLYFFTLAVTVGMFTLAWNLMRGRIGVAMDAIRNSPVAAAASGIDTAYFKSMAFGISAMYASVAGSLGAIAVQFVAPDSFSTWLSISLLVGMVVGGSSTLTGAVFGALFIQFVPQMTDQVSKAAPWAIYGVLLIVFILLMPGGIDRALRIALMRLNRCPVARFWSRT
jgi:branched-chain amino acid transport system permease protein